MGYVRAASENRVARSEAGQSIKLIAGAVISFLLAFITLRHLNPSGILFYQGVTTAVCVSIFQVAVARAWGNTSWPLALKDALLTLLLTYAFLFTIPTTVDRSYSVLMLQHLAEAPQGLSREDVSHFYVQDFVDRGGVDRRLAEQQATGTVTERNGRYVLTAEGETLTSAFRLTCQVFACQQPTQ
jgi:hypothetical protein